MKATWTFFLAIFCLTAFSQKDAQKDKKIKNIRQIVTSINKDTTFVIKTLKNEEFLENTTDRGGQLTGYFKNGQLTKIVEWVGLSNCINITEYYIKDNKLIFVYIVGKEIPYSDSLSKFDESKFSTKLEARYYFDKEKLISFIIKGSSSCSGPPKEIWETKDIDNYIRNKTLLQRTK